MHRHWVPYHLGGPTPYQMSAAQVAIPRASLIEPPKTAPLRNPPPTPNTLTSHSPAPTPPTPASPPVLEKW